MSWLTTLGKQVDYLSGRYQAYPAVDERARAGVFRVLDEVRRNELKRVHGRSALESAAFVDAEVPDSLYAIEDTRTGEIIGCVRMTMADRIAAIALSRMDWFIDASFDSPGSAAHESRDPRAAPILRLRRTATAVL
jgi:hypothetical protein